MFAVNKLGFSEILFINSASITYNIGDNTGLNNNIYSDLQREFPHFAYVYRSK